MTIIKTVSINEEQEEFLTKSGLSPSRVMQDAIDRLKKESMGEE